MLKITGTKSQIRDICLTFAGCKSYCPFMQGNIVKDCRGLQCDSLDMVYKCGMEYRFFEITD